MWSQVNVICGGVRNEQTHIRREVMLWPSLAETRRGTGPGIMEAGHWRICQESATAVQRANNHRQKPPAVLVWSLAGVLPAEEDVRATKGSTQAGVWIIEQVTGYQKPNKATPSKQRRRIQMSTSGRGRDWAFLNVDSWCVVRNILHLLCAVCVTVRVRMCNDTCVCVCV